MEFKTQDDKIVMDAVEELHQFGVISKVEINSYEYFKTIHYTIRPKKDNEGEQ